MGFISPSTSSSRVVSLSPQSIPGLIGPVGHRDQAGRCGCQAGASDKAELGHMAGCTGGSGLEVPCCQGLSLVLMGQVGSYSRIWTRE